VRRRDFISFLGGAVTAWPRLVNAEQAERMRRIGVLMALTEGDPVGQRRIAAFREGLQDLGWIEGRNIEIVFRWANPESGRLQVAAAELAGLKTDVILAGGTVSVGALLKETQTIPIVFAVVSDPIGSGFADSLARPGRNVTGFTNFEPTLGEKWLEILKEVAPGMMRIAAIFNPKTTAGAGEYYLRLLSAAAHSMGMKLFPTPFGNPDEVEPVLDGFAQLPNGGLIVLPDTSTTAHRNLIIAAAARHRLPAIYSARYFTTEGGLISYGADPNADDGFKSAASYVDRILKGDRPGDLPIQAPTKFDLVINLKTAKALGLNVPQSLLSTADEVIE
jgi:putative tryptophan/tyrosine transport system substrate-binding protein